MSHVPDSLPAETIDFRLARIYEQNKKSWKEAVLAYHNYLNSHESTVRVEAIRQKIFTSISHLKADARRAGYSDNHILQIDDELNKFFSTGT